MPTAAEVEQKVLELHRQGLTDEAMRLAEAWKSMQTAAPQQAQPLQTAAPQPVIPMQQAAPEPPSMMDRAGQMLAPGGPMTPVGLAKKAMETMQEPGFGKTAVDALGFGWGNEASSGVYAALEGVKRGNFSKFKQDYVTKLKEDEAEKRGFAEKNPLGALGTNVIGSVASGLGVGRLVNPSTWTKAVALATGEGTAVGAGMASPDQRTVGAGMGAAGGLVGGIAGPIMQQVATKAPRALQGVKQLFTGAPKLDPRTSSEMAKLYSANQLMRTGTPRNLASQLTAEEATDTVADLGGDSLRPLMQRAAASSDDAAAVGRNSIIGQEGKTLTRNEVTPQRVQDRLGTNQKTIQDNIEFTKSLKNEAKDIGKAIDARLKETSGVPLNNQDDLFEFLEMDANKGLIREAIKDMEVDGLKVPRGAGDDGNDLIIDEAMAKAIGTRLSEAVSKAKKEGVGYYQASKLNRMWRNLSAENSADDVMKNLKSEYRTTMKQSDAYELGNEQAPRWTTSKLQERIPELDAEELEAFRRGAANSFADTPDTLLSTLESEAGKRKLALTFGDPARGKADKIVASEKGYKKTHDSLQAGLMGQAGEVSEQTMQGKQSWVKNLWSRLENKRAYSVKGGAFLAANEVADIIQRADLPDEVLVDIMKIMVKSGDDATAAMQELSKVYMPQVERAKLHEAMIKAQNRQLSVGYGAAGATLTDSLMDQE